MRSHSQRKKEKTRPRVSCSNSVAYTLFQISAEGYVHKSPAFSHSNRASLPTLCSTPCFQVPYGAGSMRALMNSSKLQGDTKGCYRACSLRASRFQKPDRMKTGSKAAGSLSLSLRRWTWSTESRRFLGCSMISDFAASTLVCCSTLVLLQKPSYK